MITTTHLIEQLSKFPQGARVLLTRDATIAIMLPPGKGVGDAGTIHVPDSGRPRATRLGGWKGWMDNVFHTDGGRIQRFLLERPAAARSIAFSAVAGLYLEEDEETALAELDCYPRVSGSHYVDQVGESIISNDMFQLIQELQAEVEDA